MDNNDPNLWKVVFSHRSPEVWAAIVGGMLYVYRKSGGPTSVARSIEAGVSGLLGYSLGQDMATWSGVNSPAIATFVITSVGYLMLDVIRSLVADRAAMKEWLKGIVLKLLGGSNGK